MLIMLVSFTSFINSSGHMIFKKKTALVEKSSVGTILPYERDSTHSNTGGVLAALAV